MDNPILGMVWTIDDSTHVLYALVVGYVGLIIFQVMDILRMRKWLRKHDSDGA